jgi:hypothetical protein
LIWIPGGRDGKSLLYRPIAGRIYADRICSCRDLDGSGPVTGARLADRPATALRQIVKYPTEDYTEEKGGEVHDAGAGTDGQGRWVDNVRYSDSDPLCCLPPLPFVHQSLCPAHRHAPMKAPVDTLTKPLISVPVCPTISAGTGGAGHDIGGEHVRKSPKGDQTFRHGRHTRCKGCSLSRMGASPGPDGGKRATAAILTTTVQILPSSHT